MYDALTLVGTLYRLMFATKDTSYKLYALDKRKHTILLLPT